jgi:voltage-gated potassium channel
MHLRKLVYDTLDPRHNQGWLSRTANLTIYALIFLSVTVIVLESVAAIAQRWTPVFRAVEALVVVIFSIEYLLRLWSCVEAPKYAAPFWGRLKYLLSPLAIIDLLAVLPFYLPFVTADLLFLRAVRCLNVFRVAKLTRYSAAFHVLGRVIYAKRAELANCVTILLILTVLTAIGMFYAEHKAQPGVFPDIPSALFWAIAALTNVSHADPVTPLGKGLASVICILGLAMFALPTGVLSAGFMEEFQERQRKPGRCPHCGKELGGETGPEK